MPVSDAFGTQSTLLLALYSGGNQATGGIRIFEPSGKKSVCVVHGSVYTLSPQKNDEVSSSELRGLDNIFSSFGRDKCGVTIS